MLRRHAQVSGDDGAGLRRRGKRLRINNQWGPEQMGCRRHGGFTMKVACIAGLLIALFGQGCGRSPMDDGLPRARPGTPKTGGSGGSGQGVGGSHSESGASAAGGFGGVSAGGAAGASNATGGANGQGGGSGNGGATGTWGDCPPCLAAALNPCSPSGACVEEGHGSGMGNTIARCYANGVQQRTFFGANGNDITSGAVVSKDGKVCLSMDMQTVAFRDGTLTLKNGAGERLAEGTVAGGTITIRCDGMSYVVSDACIGRAASTGCSNGSCP
jgi:hypothetical protein